MGEAARYRELGSLGEGGMGAVRLVHDSAREEDVALKRVHVLSASSLVRFKREFRFIERLLHPNLVRLYEMGEDAHGPYFTMEVVEGVELGLYCVSGALSTGSGSSPEGARSHARERARGTGATVAADRPGALEKRGPDLSGLAPHDGAPNLEAMQRRIAHAFPQILEALSFLHAHGIVHRDLKPANVMLDREGTVKLLDFGVLASLADAEQDAGRVVGTVGFMAPEQLNGAEPRPATDVYALGAVLYLFLSGRPVFEGHAARQMVAHLTEPAPPVEALVPDVHPALAEACREMLRKDPGERPSLAQVGALLARAGARTPVLAIPRARLPVLRGRDALSADIRHMIEAGLDGGHPLIVLRGTSGSGKTALAEHLMDRTARARGALVLRSRGRANDRIAFNAIDGAIDQLAMALGRRRRVPEDVRGAAGDAALMFPVLSEVAGESAATGRAAAFDGLVCLLEHAAEPAGLVLSVDDLQWADVDSLTLLEHLLDAKPKGVVVCATLRDDVELGPPAAFVARSARARVFEVGPLDGAALRAIAEDAARDAGVFPDDEQLARIVAIADGRPFLAELAGRALDPLMGVAPLVGEAVQGSEALLALVLATDGWTQVGELSEITGRRIGEVDEEIRLLAQRGVVRCTIRPPWPAYCHWPIPAPMEEWGESTRRVSPVRSSALMEWTNYS